MEDKAGQHPDEVIQTIRVIQTTMNTIDQSLNAIADFGRRTRRITLALIISLVLDVTLTAIVGILSANAISTSNATQSETAAIKSVQHSQCVTTNEARSENKDLWLFFVQLIESQPSTDTPQQKANAQKALNILVNKINTTFRQRPCPLG
jgi:hypothetical protein